MWKFKNLKKNLKGKKKIIDISSEAQIILINQEWGNSFLNKNLRENLKNTKKNSQKVCNMREKIIEIKNFFGSSN